MNIDDILIVIPVYQDYFIARRLILQLRFLYPSSNILVFSDGTIDIEFIIFALENTVLYIVGDDRLKLNKYGAKWISRLFNFIAMYGNSHILIIEPDSYVHREIKFPKGWFNVAGAVKYSLQAHRRRFVPHGCVLYRCDTIRHICSTNILDDTKYTAPEYGYKRFSKELKWEHENEEEELVSSTDMIMCDVFYRLNIPLTDWRDIHINFRTPIDIVPGKKLIFSITHPHPNLVFDLNANKSC